jgi:predicted PurR-regulated permease PerM
MKFSFAVSVVAFIVLFVAVALLFAVLSALGVFDSLQHLVNSVTSSQGSSGYNVKKWFTASRILSYTAMLGGINIILITAISTIGSVIYNLASRLIGGVEVTLKETD